MVATLGANDVWAPHYDKIRLITIQTLPSARPQDLVGTFLTHFLPGIAMRAPADGVVSVMLAAELARKRSRGSSNDRDGQGTAEETMALVRDSQSCEDLISTVSRSERSRRAW